MGDRAYTRFSIPRQCLTTTARRKAVASIAEITVGELDAMLIGPPEIDGAGYDNATALRLVHGGAAVVIEYDQWDHGGSSAEQELIAAGIPYLRLCAAGVQYGPTVSIYSGRGDPITMYVSDENSYEVMVPMIIKKCRATLDPSWIRAANRFARIRHHLFSR